MIEVNKQFLDICDRCSGLTIEAFVDNNIFFANFQRIETLEHKVVVTCKHYDVCSRAFKKGVNMGKTKRFIDQVAEKLSEETGKDIEWCLEFIPEHGCIEFWSDYLVGKKEEILNEK